MAVPTKTFRLPASTLARLEALAKRDEPERPNMTTTLVRIVREAHRAAGLPEPEVTEEQVKPDEGGDDR